MSYGIIDNSHQNDFIGGYYTIEQKGNKLRIIALNSNAFSTVERQRNVVNPIEQLEWLEKILMKSVMNKETVYLVSHMCPGANERDQDEAPTFKDDYSANYLEMIRRFANIIVGQFCGHLHSDTFRIVYDHNKKPVSWMMVAPSLTPNKSPGVSNNPGLRLYKFNTNTGHIIDYTQYYIDLESSPNGDPDDWRIEYNLTHYYGLHEISPRSLHAIAETFQDEDSVQFDSLKGKMSVFDRARPTFELLKPNYYTTTELNATCGVHRYIEANSVRQLKPKDCNLECRRAHYCAVTELDYSRFHSCVETAAEALSGSVHSRSSKALFIAAVLLAIAMLTQHCHH
ncbi:acid sphingomyelinase-like phosphodiesterase 3a [Aphis craccivora]|uniref:Acid sphingomyelinase-like phosphodiesterase 3a n=1 Tax=Aphis craccivora TaxID=307492 RepID=A0A6G0ZCY6_APHCR|nr:acid sphingomyelinase-like phosphodiesterase 3a [Aphis craccivora]